MRVLGVSEGEPSRVALWISLRVLAVTYAERGGRPCAGGRLLVRIRSTAGRPRPGELVESAGKIETMMDVPPELADNIDRIASLRSELRALRSAIDAQRDVMLQIIVKTEGSTIFLASNTAKSVH